LFLVTYYDVTKTFSMMLLILGSSIY